MFSFNLHRSVDPATELALLFNQLSIAFLQEPHFTKKGLLSRLSHLNNFSFTDAPRAAIAASKELKLFLVRICPRQILRAESSACIKKKKILLVSYYLDRTEALTPYIQAFDKIRNYAAKIGADIIFSGDANAHSTLWGGDSTDSSGEELELYFICHSLFTLNVGETPTWTNQRYATYIDITFATDTIKDFLTNWAVPFLSKKHFKGNKAQEWWTEELADLQQKAFDAHKAYKLDPTPELLLI